jgi:hypothetical protein
MREAPSGPVNPSVTITLTNVTIGANGFDSNTYPVPGAKVGDTVTYSADSSDGIRVVPSFCIINPNEVVVSFWNADTAPYTIVSMNVYIEVIPRRS